MQDKILIEVWEKNDNKVEDSGPQQETVIESPTRLANIRGVFKKQKTVRRKKVTRTPSRFSKNYFNAI